MGIHRKPSSRISSGPSHRPRAVSSRPSVSSRKRISGRSSSSGYTPQPAPNPNPRNYKITYVEKIGSYLIVKLKYPDCTNYEGNKILLYKDVTIEKLINQGEIDPHFFEDAKVASPVARFVPTKEGLTMAQKLSRLLT